MNPSTIKEKYLEDYPIPITSESTKIILSQMENCVCKIYMDNGVKGTGFFCKIPYRENHLLSVLVTNNHIIDRSHIGKNNQIIFTINNDKIKKQLIIGERIVYTSKLYDTTIIEIYDVKDGIKDFLELSFDINEEYFINPYVKKSIYILQYPNNEKVSVSYGIINGINLQNNFDIYHFCSTDKGSSGAPNLNAANNKLIGIHKGTNENHKFNKGTNLFFPIKEFISQKKEDILKPKKFILKNKVKKVINQPSSSFGCIKHFNKQMIYNETYEFNNEGYQIFGLIDENLYGVLEGPPNTIYENGFFQFRIRFPMDFIFKPPRFIFQTKIFHPNIDTTGNVSVDILQDEWSPAICIFSKIIYSVQSLLDDPNADIFVNEEAAKLYKENKEAYKKTVREWTSKYANFDTVQNELKKLNFEMEL